MEQTIHTPETYDFRKYDQIWRRVAPNLEPYPDLREPAVPAMAPLASGAAPAAPQPAAVPAMEQLPGADDGLLPHHRELLPPGGGQRADSHR